MDSFTQLLHWFTGGDRQYMRLYGCMRGDSLWIGVTISLDIAIAIGYVVIASHWWKNQRTLPNVPAKSALSDMRNIFIFCGLCGYVFVPIKMFWPAWRLYDFALLILAYYTWRYALTTSNLKVVYSELGRSTQLAADLERSQQNAKRQSQFLNALSHDLRTPLNGLSLQTTLAEMSMRQGDQPALAQALADIKSSTKATAALLDSLLECVRADWSEQANTATRFSLDAMLVDLGRRFQSAAADRSLDLRMSAAKGLTLFTDRTKLDRILSNLLSNAVKFTKDGSIRVEVEQSREGVEIHVIDTGVGIAPEDHERLFDEFFQLHNRERDPAKGFGLGLSIARRFAQQLGGDIVLQSALGKGSRFSVVLPRVLANDNVTLALEPARSTPSAVPATPV